MENMDWKEIWRKFEKEITFKLEGLPDHREVSDNLLELRSIISHELPETTSIKVFQQLIEILNEQKQVDLEVVKDRYLKPQLIIENRKLSRFKSEIPLLKELARDWIKDSLPEEKLARLWKKHQTWLPRRYTLYKKNTSFENIAVDTLVRFYLIKLR